MPTNGSEPAAPEPGVTIGGVLGKEPADRHAAQLTVGLAAAGFFLITLDILIVNVALSRIERELGGGTVGQQWVVDGYTLLFAALLLSAGGFADRIGAKRAFGVGVTLFGVTSVVCAVSPTIGTLIAARGGQGASAALMLPASMALIREAFPDQAGRARALGVWAVGGAVAAALGPLLGGLLTTVGWRWVFAVNVPVCAGIVVALRRVAPSPTRSAPLDWAGQVLAVMGLAAATFGLIEGGPRGFASALVVVSVAFGVAALATFVAVERRVEHPMMPLLLFSTVGMRIAVTVGFAFLAGWFGTVFVGSLYLQQHLGLDPLLAGLVFLPSALFSVIGNLVSGPVTNRFGTRTPVLVGLSAMAVGLAVLALIAPLGSPWLMALVIVPIGAGGSLAMPPTTGLVLASVSAEWAGTASAVFNTFRQVGGALAIAVFGALISHPTHFVAGMQASLAIAAVLVLAAAAAALAIRDRAIYDVARPAPLTGRSG